MKKFWIPEKIFNIPILPFVRINIWTLPIFVFSFLGGYLKAFIFAYLSSFLHELAHILCAILLKVKISGVFIYPFGISAKLKNGYIRSSEKEFLIAFSGPFLSLVLFFIFSGLGIDFKVLADINLSLCLINLLPSLPLDGGRMLKSILTERFGIIRAYNFMLRLSKVSICILLLFDGALIFISGFNFSLILISAFLLQNLTFEQKAVPLIALREILKSREVLSDIKNMRIKHLCVKAESTASGILKSLSYDHFYLINVIDKNSHIIKTLTETEVLNSLIANGIRTKYKDI